MFVLVLAGKTVFVRSDGGGQLLLGCEVSRAGRPVLHIAGKLCLRRGILMPLLRTAYRRFIQEGLPVSPDAFALFCDEVFYVDSQQFLEQTNLWQVLHQKRSAV